jgi:hypothetical protein
MWTYTAKNYSTVTDYVMAARFLATEGVKATIKGMTLTTDATPVQVSEAAKAGYAKWGF